MRFRESRTYHRRGLAWVLVLAVSSAVPTAAEPGTPPQLSMLEITADPPIELSEYDRRLLQKGCIERLPEFIKELHGDPAHSGPYDVHLQVTKVEPIAEHLDVDAGRVIARRAVPTIQHGLKFWDVPPLQMANPVLMIVPPPQIPDLEMGPYPQDARIPVEVYRSRGQRFVCTVEVTFEGHGTHSTVLHFDHAQSIVFPRTVQGGEDQHGNFVTRALRHPIRWSASTIQSDTMLTGAAPALEVLRVQLSGYTDGVKRKHIEQYGRAKHRDRHTFERPLWRLDAAENAVVITVGRMWIDALARDRRHEPRAEDVRALLNLGAPGVAELLSEYPTTRDGAAALIAAYTGDPMALVAKIGPVLDR